MLPISRILTQLDPFMIRLLSAQPKSVTHASTKGAKQAVRLSLLFSGTRCILQYLILPFALPFIGIAADATIPILLIFNGLAVVSLIASLRRFWQVGYKYRWHYLSLVIFVFSLLILFTFLDIRVLLH